MLRLRLCVCACAERPVILATRKKAQMLAAFEVELAKLRAMEWQETPKFTKQLKVQNIPPFPFLYVYPGCP
eukprot:COSAG05_NODE_214_length_13907_cov_28.992178_5_plen_71_part_00